MAQTGSHLVNAEESPALNARSIYLVRHGETYGNVEGTAQGQNDALLTDRGHRQAQALAARFSDASFAAVYSSDLQRAKDTAKPIIEAIGDLSLEIRMSLREIDYGDYTELPWSDMRKNDPGLFWDYVDWEMKPDVQWPNGESERDLWNRVGGFIKEVEQTHRGNDDSILVVCHGGPIHALMSQLLDLRITDQWRFRVDNASVTILTEHPFNRGVWQAQVVNDTSHLGTHEV